MCNSKEQCSYFKNDPDCCKMCQKINREVTYYDKFGSKYSNEVDLNLKEYKPNILERFLNKLK